MARARMIRPEFWSDEKLASVSREARLTFAGLWGTSDDYGVTKGNAAWLKSQIFPYDDDIKISKFQEWLSELENLQRILPFTTDCEKYYYIPKFSEHQKVDKPSKTRNPERPLDILSRVSRESVASVSRESSDEVNRSKVNISKKKRDILSGNNGLDGEVKAVIEYLNLKAGTKFTPNGKQSTYIHARLKDGATVDQCLEVVDKKCGDWLGDSKMHKFIRPSTLFNNEKFEGYLNESSNPANQCPGFDWSKP